MGFGERDRSKLPGSKRLGAGVHWTIMRGRAWGVGKYRTMVARLTISEFGVLRLQELVI